MAGRDARMAISGLKPRGRAGGKARTRLCARRWRSNVRDEFMCTAYMVGTSPCHRRPRAPDFRRVKDEAGGGSDAWSCGHLLASCSRASQCRCRCASIGWIWAACFRPQYSTPPRPPPGAEARRARARSRPWHARPRPRPRPRYTRRGRTEASHSDTSIVLPPPFSLRPRPTSSLHACPLSPRRRSPYVTDLAASMDATRTMTKTGTISPPLFRVSSPPLSLILI
ncbi:hypothetical protein C8R44DRAFT_381697 [Mycena epipterygia]|nr:hypothetical protein C8R44DRAFT_381697 [Mycena epipterygia]